MLFSENRCDSLSVSRKFENLEYETYKITYFPKSFMKRRHYNNSLCQNKCINIFQILLDKIYLCHTKKEKVTKIHKPNIWGFS